MFVIGAFETRQPTKKLSAYWVPGKTGSGRRMAKVNDPDCVKTRARENCAELFLHCLVQTTDGSAFVFQID
jgi:hypothetical protein